MRWGHICDDVRPEDQRLYWVLMWILLTPIPSSGSVYDALKDVLPYDGGDGTLGGGDPGWQMDLVLDQTGKKCYRVWADPEMFEPMECVLDQTGKKCYHEWVDPEMSGFEPGEQFYSVEAVHHALKESLLAFGERFPDKAEEAKEIIARYGLSFGWCNCVA